MRFFATVPETILAKLRNFVGNDASVPNPNRIPFRWIQGDTEAHIDRSASEAHFDHTYLIYLQNDPSGKFVIGTEEYDIKKGYGYMFDEGISHYTYNTTVPRLLIGPMSSNLLPVGAPAIIYYENETDALASSGDIGYSFIYTVGTVDTGDIGAITSWRIASNSTGPDTGSGLVYENGAVLTGGGYYNLYPNITCFLENTQIECIHGNIEIQHLRRGMLVKTVKSGYLPVELIGYVDVDIDNSKDNPTQGLSGLYYYPSHNLVVTGCHSVLREQLTDEEYQSMKQHAKGIFVTDGYYRLMAALDSSAERWQQTGNFRLWHFALKSSDPRINFGVYANGLLTESCSIVGMKKYSNMTLV